MSYNYTYVYLSSPSYVGSSFLELIMSAHPQVATVGELAFNFSKYYQCTCGKRFCDCEFWADWQTKVRAEGLPFEIGSLNINLQPTVGKGFWDSLYYYEFASSFVNNFRDWLYTFPSFYREWGAVAQDAVSRAERYAEILCQSENAPVFFDSSKNPYQVRFLSRHLKNRFKLIYMMRDARAQINDLMKREKRSLEEAVLLFRWYSRNLERIIKHYVRPEDVFRIRYEDLCDDTTDMLKSLCRFLEIEQFPELTPEMTALPNKYHFLTNMYQPFKEIQLQDDKRWQSELSSEQIAYIDKELGAINKFYGYE